MPCPGDRVLGAGGEWLTIEGVTDATGHAVVYNLEVLEAHTFFVGDADWGFAVWVHNLNACEEYLALKRAIDAKGGAKTAEEFEQLKQLKLMAETQAEAMEKAAAGTTKAARPAPTGPVKSGETMTLEDFKGRSVIGDKLEGHEIWQHANLKSNGLAGERLSTAASKNNPIIVLDQATHAKVTAAQSELSASAMTPIENIKANAEILRSLKAAPSSAINQAEAEAIAHARSLGHTK